ncbi:MAG: cupin domain-containing protein [Clostridiales bacterium]|nr:cupin domain-containing protein [Clostridiales bacterium]
MRKPNEASKEIAKRIKELREILDITAEDMSTSLGVSVEEYLRYESGEKDIPISTIYKIAAALGVDYTVLLTGDDPKMDTYTVVRRGEGVHIDRYEGYEFESLAANFKGKEMEPMIVTLQPNDNKAPLVIHGGQEFNFCLKGRVRVTVGKNEIVLCKGDSIYFNPGLPHGQAADGETAVFLTVINE